MAYINPMTKEWWYIFGSEGTLKRISTNPLVEPQRCIMHALKANKFSPFKLPFLHYSQI